MAQDDNVEEFGDTVNMTANELRARKSELDDDDYAHMREVVGYAKRHLAQRP